MLRSFRPQQRAPEVLTPDPETGEIPMGNTSLALPPVPPDFSKIKSLSDKIGAQPPWINLRDHPELNGAQIGIVSIRYNPMGEFGPYVNLACFILDQNKKPQLPGMVISTGAANVVTRAIAVMETVNKGEPVTATLRAVPGTAGQDAWLMD